jgi:hypothetical protein
MIHRILAASLWTLLALSPARAHAAGPSVSVPHFVRTYRANVELMLKAAGPGRDGLLNQLIAGQDPFMPPTDLPSQVATAAVGLKGLHSYAQTHFAHESELHARLKTALRELVRAGVSETKEKENSHRTTETALRIGAADLHLALEVPARQVLLSASRRFFVSLSREEGALARVEVGDVATGKILHGIVGFKAVASTSDPILSPVRDEIFFRGPKRGGVEAWDLATGQKLRSFKAGRKDSWPHTPKSLQISPDGKQLAFEEDFRLRVLDADTFREIKIPRFYSISHFAFADEPGRIAVRYGVGGGDRIGILDTVTGKKLKSVESPDDVLEIAYSSRHDRLVESWRDGGIRYRVRHLEADQTTTLPHEFQIMTPDGRYALSDDATFDRFQVVDLDTRQTFTAHLPIPTGENVRLKLSEDGRTLTAATGEKDSDRSALFVYDFARALSTAQP